MARELEHKQPVPPQDAHELADVALDRLRARLVLKNDPAVDQIKRLVLESLEVRPVVDDEPAVRALLMQLARPLDHRLRDIDADDLVEALGQCSGGAPEPAAEVERAAQPTRPPELVRASHQRRNLLLARAEEITRIPATEFPVGCREDDPVRVLARHRVPLAPMISEGAPAQ